MADVLDMAVAGSDELRTARTRVQLQVLEAVERELAHMGAGYAETVLRLTEAYRQLEG